MNTSTETIMYYIIAAGVLSIVYGFITGRNILNSSSGNAKMLEIASAIQEGARAYLNRQYKTIAIVGVVVLIIITILFTSPKSKRNYIQKFFKKMNQKVTLIGNLTKDAKNNEIIDINKRLKHANNEGYSHNF